jgi:putative endonuclease
MPQKRNNKTFGKIGEDRAAKLLRNKGYKIIEQNYTTKLGEIDLIAIDVDTLVFVEVKTRWSKKFGNPEEAVNLRKLN